MAAARSKQIGSQMGALFAADPSLLNLHLQSAARLLGRDLDLTQLKTHRLIQTFHLNYQVSHLESPASRQHTVRHCSSCTSLLVRDPRLDLAALIPLLPRDSVKWKQHTYLLFLLKSKFLELSFHPLPIPPSLIKMFSSGVMWNESFQ